MFSPLRVSPLCIHALLGGVVLFGLGSFPFLFLLLFFLAWCFSFVYLFISG